MLNLLSCQFFKILNLTQTVHVQVQKQLLVRWQVGVHSKLTHGYVLITCLPLC